MDNKLPKQRGIYSEILTTDNQETLKYVSTIGPASEKVIEKNLVQKFPRAKGVVPKKERVSKDEKFLSKAIYGRKTETEGYYSKKREGVSEIEPKVMEPYVPIPGRAPRKVVIDRKKKEYSSLNIEDLLDKEGVDFRNPKATTDSWIPLEPFYDISTESRNPDEWIDLGTKGESFCPITGKGLRKDQGSDTYYWSRVLIYGFDEETDSYEGIWDGTEERCKLTRPHVLFDAEDPIGFARRVGEAHRHRQFADALLRYNYIIDNMPTQDIPTLDSEQTTKIISMAHRNRIIPIHKLKPGAAQILNEINLDFARTMNKIIYDTYTKQGFPTIIPSQLQLPEDEHQKKEVRESGMCIIPPHNFSQDFSSFCFSTLYIKEEVIEAMVQIRNECNEIEGEEIFNQEQGSVRLEEFKQKQESKIFQTSNFLKETWVNKITNLIKGSFGTVGKGWFNINETSKETYDFGKLKKLLTVIRIMMQEAILELSERSLNGFVNKILSHLPRSTIVNGPGDVVNIFQMDRREIRKGSMAISVKEEGEEEEKKVEHDDEIELKTKIPEPLFEIDLMLKQGDDGPKYSTDPNTVPKVVLDVFDKGVSDFQQISQLEPKVLKELFKNQSKMFLKAPARPKTEPDPKRENPELKAPIEDENLWVWNLYKTLEMKIERAVEPLFKYQKQYDKYDEIHKLNPEEYVKKELEDEENPASVIDIRKDIYDTMEKEKNIKNEIPESIVVSIFRVNCKDVRNLFVGKYAQIIKNEKELIARRLRSTAEDLMIDFDRITEKIKTPPKGLPDLTELKEYMKSVPAEIVKKQLEIDELMNYYDILEEFGHQLPKDDLDNRWIIYESPKKILELIEHQSDFLDKRKEYFLNAMLKEQEEFQEKIEDLQNIVESFSQYQNIKDFSQVSDNVTDIMGRIKDCKAKASEFNHKELLVGKDQTNYNQVNLLIKDFTPYYNLWTTANTWFTSHAQWLNGSWDQLNSRQLQDTVDNSIRTILSVLRYFREKVNTISGADAILGISEQIKKEIDVFKPFVPLAVALRTEGMKDRHWKDISQNVGFHVNPYKTEEQLQEEEKRQKEKKERAERGEDVKEENIFEDVKALEEFNLQKVIDMKLFEKLDVCIEVGDKADREFKIENKLRQMKLEWENVEFRLIDFKATKTFYVTGFDDASVQLDDHIITTQGLQFSLFKGPFEKDIDDWNATLMRVSDVIEEWTKCQGNWMYLQPIFDSPDIINQLPNEASRFKGVDTLWRSTMNQTKENPNVLAACSREGLLEKLQGANTNLELIQKGLNEYLESKRSKFARFYFLSNDELLQILSQTKEVENVRPHLKKVFENMHDLEFHADKTMHAMFSAERERIDFVEPVDPKKTAGVEYWMGDVEREMQRSVRNVLLKSIIDYKKRPRTDWCLQHPGQCVLNGSQIHWTHEVEQALIKHGPKGAKLYFKKLTDQLMETVKLVRKQLSKMEVITLNALIVIDVHAKDVVENLAELEISDINAFEWIMQLRYYWENGDCFVACIQTRFPYGYEYLGNTLRLVITPLTDKCFMTLMGALKLNLGGAPAGPAGTGKTESVKDLAKGVAKQCVVFNCSEGMDHLMVAKFFKGLASAGAWCCFDEFNRINIEVLSVIAQQLLQLFEAKANQEEEILFEESHIKMKPTFSVYITMNPGYAGRTELPDNLKALFRPMAMMVPDYALIAAIMLYSFGFQTAKDLARKMVVTFKLSSEQLSAQDHYDYGMRAVRSVINAAGLLKRATPDMNEDQLLLRALRDVNVPKFLLIDLPLFENIILDLFPGVDRPEVNYGDLVDKIHEACSENNLQPINSFIEKILQLYDTIQVRHGLMIVGPTGGGKTSNYQVLAKAMSKLAHLPEFSKVNYHIINPKSVTMGQLYGMLDPMTSEWVDGIAAIILENCSKDESPERHWMMFDGPVDSLWIESMNTVLDDNKKLCLNSGKIIPLSERMTMMFEVEDLAVASPATVSRCGMVYMEPTSIGLDPLLLSWIQGQPSYFQENPNFQKTLEKCFKGLVESGIDFLRKYLKEPVGTVDNNLCQSIFRLMDCFFFRFKDTEIKKTSQEEVAELVEMLPEMFYFSFIWSIGVTTNLEGREKFNKKARELLPIPELNFEFPEEGWVYDYCYDSVKKEWIKWRDTQGKYQINANLENFQEILVPTSDSIRMIHLAKMLITHSKHVLTPGPTGTGKSVNITDLLTTGLSDAYQSLAIMFSAQTSANQTQDALDDKLDKRRKGVYGPPPGKKFIIFVDDLNMPKKETFGAQPPIELLRQYMDHKGWYDRKIKEKPYRRIEDIIFISAMGPPGGGRSPITQRLQRHFNIITYTLLQEEAIRHIFTTILQGFLGGARFNAGVRDNLGKIIDMTLIVYSKVLSEMRPTPTKSHYTFNMRDISKIIQGVCSAEAKSTENDRDLIRIWVHENQRVFGDRLISQPDHIKLDDFINTQIKETFGYGKDKIYIIERLIYGDYMQGLESDRKYERITDIKALINKIEEYLEEYNQFLGSKRPMKLVMFLDACDHVSRICRVLRQPQGNALLLGVGGSGRQSLARLATFIAGLDCRNIEVVKGYTIGSWKEDLKGFLKDAGILEKKITFLFCDTQIISEQMLEDINGVLNSGDVPGIYKKEDMEDIEKVGREECMKRHITATKMNNFSQYLSRIKKNIHIVLAMSPLGEVFRDRLRKFPSLVNCCTIDWFTEWPEEALLGVARGDMAEKELGLGDNFDSVVEMFKIMHQDVEKKSISFFETLRRRNYVTPTSYLELLQLYGDILQKKRKENLESKRRLEKGLKVLFEAKVVVEKLQDTLSKKQPELEQTKKEVLKTKEQLAKDKASADETRRMVADEEQKAAENEKKTAELKEDADIKLAEANPALEAAVKILNELKKDDFYEIKVMKVPLETTVVILEALCHMFEKKPKKNRAQNPSSQYDPQGYFQTAINELLNEPAKLLQAFKDYDKENIPDIVVKKVNQILGREDVNETKVKQTSKALLAFYFWLQAMMKYNHVLKTVKPLRAEAAKMDAELKAVRAYLAEKRKMLREIDEQIESLERKYMEEIERENNLTAQINDCNVKVERASKLIGGLVGEKARWENTVRELTDQYNSLIGDCLIASGMVAYCGCFTSEYRNELEQDWVERLNKLKIKHSLNLTMKNILGDEIKIRQWNVNHLPSDNVSIQNGIITFTARRWPLMIDPQNQANKFIKNMGNEHEGRMDTFKLSEGSIIKQLETAIELGKWVLLEGIGEKLDPSLDPILMMQRIEKGEPARDARIGEKTIKYDYSFSFFMTTTLPNPHYAPEVVVRVTVLNFAITPQGLEEQLLNLLVSQEMPELQEKKTRIVTQNAKSAKELHDIEEEILGALTSNEDTAQILEDETLINMLGESKKKSEDIKEKVRESKKTEEEIDATRKKYKSVAFRASLLFFCITDLSNIDPMYQYSLQWYSKLFSLAIDNAPASNELSIRITNIIDYFTLNLYENVCRSLFEKHKLLFSFLLTTKILFGDNKIDMQEWRYFLAGPSGEIDIIRNPYDWLSDKEWGEMYKQIYGLSKIPKFKDLDKALITQQEGIKKIFDSDNAHREPMPGDWNTNLDDFQKLIVLKGLRSDKITPGMQDFIVKYLGQKFIEPPTFDLAKCFKDSNVTSPLIFILSQGSDPISDFKKFAEEAQMSKKLESISLGKGQAGKAERMIEEAKQRGGWVLLQNCHLSISWMPKLEIIVENLTDSLHRDFRLWLTSMPCKEFPVSTLQNSVKMTIEPPAGLRANLLRTYTNLDNKELGETKDPASYQKLLFGFCFFHAIVQDRRRFGPIGWNIEYEFNNEDLKVCRRQLKIFIDEYDDIPYKVLTYLGGEINYGGRVTDDKDVRLIKTIVRQYITPSIFEEDYKFSESGTYYAPESGEQEHYLEYIRSLPLHTHPEVFGLNANAEITTSQSETRDTLMSILSIQPRTASGGMKSREDQISEMAAYLETKTPKLLDMEIIDKNYEIQYTESMNTVLKQEAIRYNRLIAVMQETLKQVQRALIGEEVMSEDLELMSTSLYDNQVPTLWAEKGFLSLKPLASWIKDLNDRVVFLQEWIDNGTPEVFWISGFFFPQAFLTGTLQNYARKHVIAIDRLTFQFNIIDDKEAKDIKQKPDDGCYVYGMFLEGARWNYKEHVLDNSLPKELYTDIPLMHFLPEVDRKIPETGIYNCPTYKVLSRQGTLSTTGHSTNFVLFMEFPSKNPENKWILAGVAAFLALRY